MKYKYFPSLYWQKHIKFIKILSLGFLLFGISGCLVYQNQTFYQYSNNEKNTIQDYVIETRLIPHEKNFWIPPTIVVHKQKDLYSIEVIIENPENSLDSVIINRVDLMTGTKTIFSDVDKGCKKQPGPEVNFAYRSNFFDMLQGTENLTLIVQVEVQNRLGNSNRKVVKKVAYDKIEHIGWGWFGKPE